jgi:predicted GTPase
VLVVEDGPPLTHGGMSYGAGAIAAKKFGADQIVDPRPYAVGRLKKTFETYPKTGPVLPAMGYSHEQIQDLETTINRVECDLVLFSTPIQLKRILNITKPSIRVRYEYKDHGEPYLKNVLLSHLKPHMP